MKEIYIYMYTVLYETYCGKRCEKGLFEEIETARAWAREHPRTEISGKCAEATYVVHSSCRQYTLGPCPFPVVDRDGNYRGTEIPVGVEMIIAVMPVGPWVELGYCMNDGYDGISGSTEYVAAQDIDEVREYLHQWAETCPITLRQTLNR